MLRPLTPLPMNLPALHVLNYATSTAYPCGISLDRGTIYGANPTDNGKLWQSTDDAANWTQISTAFGTERINALIETDDGEALVFTESATSTPGYVWKSTGWAASHTTATWTKVLTTIGGNLPGFANLAQIFGDNTIAPDTSRYGIIAEYGSQTTVTFASGNSNTTDLTKARRAYMTSNYGATWTQVFDIAAFFPNATNLHIHAAAFDAWWRRLWLTIGDTTTNTVGANRLAMVYSDDLGATWNLLPTMGNISNAGYQATSMVFTPDAIVLASDNTPGIVWLPRQPNKTLGDPVPLVALNGSLIAQKVHRNRRQAGAPILAGFQNLADEQAATLLISPDGGSWADLWRDDLLRKNAVTTSNGTLTSGSVTSVFGPTQAGRVVAMVEEIGNSTIRRVLRAELHNPGPGHLARRSATFTGDGTTTTFATPHGLSVTPRRFTAYDSRGTAGAYTVSADATNIVVTCTTAPANGVRLAFDLRYAP